MPTDSGIREVPGSVCLGQCLVTLTGGDDTATSLLAAAAAFPLPPSTYPQIRMPEGTDVILIEPQTTGIAKAWGTSASGGAALNAFYDYNNIATFSGWHFYGSGTISLTFYGLRQ